MPPVVSIRGVSRHFRLYHESYHSLKERIIHFGRTSYEDFWALRDIDLDIEEGSSIGLLGANGSGKSTLLKCVAGILRPTDGEVRVRGRIAALLELGAGFQPELTGRENIFLNGSLLGMPQKELERRFDEIVAFAELEQFIDTQVRFYSSGMYVRLGFAIAVNVDPDILLVDEVLAVGDETFQRKCLERIRAFQREGRTIVMVTHAVEQVRQICDAAAVLDGGRLVTSGTPGEAIRSYREHLLEHARERREAEVAAATPEASEEPVEATDHDAMDLLTDQERRRTLQVTITSSSVTPTAGPESGPLLPDAGLEIRLAFESALSTSDVNFGIAIHDHEGRVVFGSNTRLQEQPVTIAEGPGEAVFHLPRVPLLDGTYLVTLGITSLDEGVVYDWREQQLQFEVMNPGGATGYASIPMSIDITGSPVSQSAPQ